MDIRRCGPARYYNITPTKLRSADLVGVVMGAGEWGALRWLRCMCALGKTGS